MRLSGTTLAVCVLLGSAVGTTEAEASRTRQEPGPAPKPVGAAHVKLKAGHHRAAAPQRHRIRTAGAWAGISCVPYARSVTGMEVYGNGGDWWWNAAGRYHRGQMPEPGSVMAFRRSGGMAAGHVAVVSRVLGPRHVLIDHANWAGPGIRKGTIMHNVSVVDVSEANDWTAVRVQVGYDQGAYGRTYPTYGFIYNRPEGDTATAYASAPALHRSLRFEQLAEMPIGAAAAEPIAYRPQGTAPLRKAAPQRHR
ncbi:CHAP domain-containing protein [Paracraurococcus lichenis]|uniref:CHAP domain-containing protein n=1 Tax=Paracraurococcus lichenis TaxID=3064888 RepID=A0ABT9DWP4_9PROT|nr:CHAP domain-containing protein [Paracraurococcus sp. LOR1-02]MDO9708312.1 CHAP domain-containing protein [Paracraurococcus sp. LOR1-02]